MALSNADTASDMPRGLDASLMDAIAARLKREEASLDPILLQRYEVASYIKAFDAVSHYGRYSFVPQSAMEWSTAIERAHGTDVLEVYHRVVLLTLIADFRARAGLCGYPPPVEAQFERAFRSLLSRMDGSSAGFYLHGNDAFAKDLAVCRQKLVPCGAQVVDVRAGVPRGIAVRQGGLDGARFLAFMLGTVGGFRVLYQMHMDPRLILDFSERGWERCYVRIARLLEQHPEVLGVYGTSWWFDPALHAVSPRLDFLRTMPQAGGARLFRSGESEHTIANALTGSKERRMAFDEGRYRPTDWLLVWPRRQLIAWARDREC